MADAYALRGRNGLKKTVAGWVDPNHDGIDRYGPSTIYSLVERGLLELWVNRTVAHISDHGAAVHEQLCAEEKAR